MPKNVSNKCCRFQREFYVGPTKTKTKFQDNFNVNRISSFEDERSGCTGKRELPIMYKDFLERVNRLNIAIGL
jgi:hypothetical protein